MYVYIYERNIMYVGTFQIREVISRNITPLQKRVINEKRWPCIKNLVIIRELVSRFMVEIENR